MSTEQIPTLDMNKLNEFIGQFVTDKGASVHTATWRKPGCGGRLPKAGSFLIVFSHFLRQFAYV